MNELERQLRSEIKEKGPITIDRYMAACLADPRHGYYMRKDPLGKNGDFITAPEISQMFGELLGLWAAVVWQSMGEPSPVVVVEMGPGRGTLMADFLRAAGNLPAFRKALRLHLVETSPILRQCQRQALGDQVAGWHDRVEDLPDGPVVMIANEFFDALPIKQYIRGDDGWHERLIDLRNDVLAFTEGPLVPLSAPPAMTGDYFEINEPARSIAGWIGDRLAQRGGAALVVDYGHPQSAPGDTLQAVKHHRPVPVLETPGEADLTAHVDFQALAEAATPATATSVVTQGSFLRSLGIEIRAERLMKAVPQKADVVFNACRRLIEPTGMGTLFKVRALTHPGLPPPPGFAY